MAKIYLYNTLMRKKEEFKPFKEGFVGIYSCGPTVYWYQHIGNMRTYVCWDVLKRMFLFNQLRVKQVMNYTDVGHLTSDADTGEDKMEKASAREGKTAKEISEFYIKDFEKQAEMLNILAPEVKCKATEHIKQQIEFIKELERKGYTYKTSDGLYMDTSKIKDYGKLARLKRDEVLAGKRVSFGDKRNATDFALWKFSESPGERQQEWESPWGVGFPGWHIECSVMSTEYLGDRIDIHTGGQDHINVHHPNEMAQNYAYFGRDVVRYWLHSGFLVVNNQKVSKSSGGFKTITEMQKEGYNPLAARYFYLLTHYRKPINFTNETLAAAVSAYESLKRKAIELSDSPSPKRTAERQKVIEKQIEVFRKAINDDLNIPKGIAIMNKMLKSEEFNDSEKCGLLRKYDEVLGLKLFEEEKKETIPEVIKKLVEERESARKIKNWKRADELRDKIMKLGYSVDDSGNKSAVKKI